MGVTREQLTQLIGLVALGVWHSDRRVQEIARSVIWQLEQRARSLSLLEALPTDGQHPVTVDLPPSVCANVITALDHVLASYSHPSNRADIVAWQVMLDLATHGEIPPQP